MLGLLVLPLFQAQAVAPPPKRPSDLLALTDQARALPPEFCADVLLRLVATGRVQESKWKRELIEEAFRAGAHAQLPYRRRGGVHTDTRQSHEAWDNKLEALTLQSRAVQAMTPIDPLRARAMFDEIAFPELPNPDCKEALTPQLDIYYLAATNVFPAGFTPKEIEKEDHVRFLKRLIGSMRSPAQTGLVFLMLEIVKPTAEQKQALFGMYAAALDRVSGSSRAFADRLVVPAAMRRSPNETMPAMATAIRNYIVRHLSGARCSDTLPKDGKPEPLVEQFNSLLAGVNLPDIKPISAEEVQPLKVEGTFKLDEFWQSPRSKQVLERLRWLTHGNRDMPGDKRFWTLEERSANEWTARYYDTFKLIEGWKEDEEPSREEYFAMKAGTYGSLARLAPPGKARDTAMGQYLQFLEQTYFLIENHNYWFTDLSFRLSEARTTKDAANRAWILSELGRSANPVIATYAQLTRMEPQGK